MSNKRFTISFNDTDIDLVRFFNSQQNASLSMRYLCKQWITLHGTGDVIDYSATHPSDSQQEHVPGKDKDKTNDTSSAGDTLSDALDASNDNLDDDFDDVF